ncbi:MAG: DUF4291 domain-containing protein [Ketobacter sp.]|nr:DUF4291 domain-containing protein [Ketobacter sp.]
MLKLKKYKEQLERWPNSGKHIMAQYDEETVVVYQAYRPSIGNFAAKNQFFGGDFKYTRMSWIKPNFLWMMFRSGWGKKEGQEVTLAIYLHRDFFNRVLVSAYPSTCPKTMEFEAWKRDIANTNVRLQWDPDHDPNGNCTVRRAIQLGLRNEFLEPFKGDGIAKIEDISDFVAEQYEVLQTKGEDYLMTPEERPYLVDEVQSKALAMEK